MKLNIQRFAVSKSTKFTEPDLTDAMINGNYSTLKIKITFSANNSQTYFSGKTLKCTCNGVQKTASVSHSVGGSVSKTFTFEDINHDPNGTKSVSWSWSCATGTSVLGTISDSGTKTLQPIPRASEISSVSDITTPNAPTVKWTPLVSPAAFYIHYTVGATTINSNPILTSGNNEETYNSTSIPSSVFNNYQTATRLEGTAKLDTYKMSGLDYEYLGTTTKTFIASLDENAKPTATIGTITEADSTMASFSPAWGVYVQNHSKLSIPITATGIYGSKITQIIVTTNGETLTYTPTTPATTITHTFTTGSLKTTGTNTISVVVYDSRNRNNSSSPTTTTYSVVSYSDPLITRADIKRVNSSNVEDDVNGTYLNISFLASINSMSSKNKNIFRVGYREKGVGSFTYKTLVNDDKTHYALVNNGTSGVDKFINYRITDWTLNASKEYEVRFEAIDSFNPTSNPIYQIRVLSTGFDLMNFNESGKAMAIGKVSSAASNENLFEVALPTTFSEYVKNDLEVENIKNKNLYDLDKSYSWTSNNTTWYFVDGTSGAYGSDIGKKTNLKAKVENGKLYTFKIGTLTNSASTQLVYDDETIINGNASQLTNGTSFTSTKNGYVLLRVRVESGQTVTIGNVQLEKGSTATNYYPYQELNAKNLLDKDLVAGKTKSKNLLGLLDGEYSNSGITAKVKDGVITLNGTATATSFVDIRLTEKLEYLNGSYTLSTFNTGTTNDSNTGIRFYFSDTTNSNMVLLNSTFNSRTFNFDGTKVVKSITIRTTSGVSYNNLVIKPQLEKGSSSTTYYSHQNLNMQIGRLTQDEFLTLNNGFTISEFNVNLVGNLLVASIRVNSTNAFTTSNSTPFTIKEKYRPPLSFYKECALASAEWKIENVGYNYIGTNGNCIIVNQTGVSNYKYAVLSFFYMINIW